MYKITKIGDTLSVAGNHKDGYSEKKVYYNWSRLPQDREYTVYLAWANSEGEALDIGKALINDYIRKYHDPIVTIREVVEGKKTGSSYEEIIHTICLKLLEMEKEQ